MKKNVAIVILFLCFSTLFFCQSVDFYSDDYIQFKKVENEKVNYDKKKYDPSKVQVWVNYLTNKRLKNWNYQDLSPLLYKQLKQDSFMINKEHLYKLMAENDFFKSGTYSLGPNWYYYYGRIEYNDYVSYHTLKYNDKIVGEYYNYVSHFTNGINYDDDYLSLNYIIRFVIDDAIVDVKIVLVWGDFSGVYDLHPELFEKRSDGKYYWANNDSINKFCEILNSDEYDSLPENMKLAREVKDAIVNTLVIKDRQ